MYAVAALAEDEATDPSATTATPTTNAVGPRIQFDKTVYDFGRTSMVQQLTGKFTYQNVGNAVLQLRNPTTSCGCTVASVEPETLKPGEKGELVFTLTVGPSVRGRVEKSITVPSNDPTTPSVELAVQVDMTSVFDFSPRQISLGDMRQGAITNVAVLVKRTDGKKLVISRADAAVNFIRTRIEPLEESSNTSARIWIEAKAEGAPRRFVWIVRVYGEDALQLLFTVTAFGRVVGEVTLNPEVLRWNIEDPEHWPDGQPESMTTRKVRVEASDKGNSLEVKNATSSLKALRVSVVAVETGRVYEVVASLSEPPKETENGTISFETNRASQPSVLVPVTINVVKRRAASAPGGPSSAR
jgi:hypothetical protein